MPWAPSQSWSTMRPSPRPGGRRCPAPSRAPKPRQGRPARRCQTRLAGVRQHAAGRLPAALRHRGVRGLRADAAGVPGHDRRGRRLDHQHHLGGIAAARRRALPRPQRRSAARLRRIQGGARASHPVRRVRSRRPQHRGERAVAVETDPHAGPVVLRPRVRRHRLRRRSSPRRRCGWRWWTRARSPGARSVIARCSTAASGRSHWPSCRGGSGLPTVDKAPPTCQYEKSRCRAGVPMMDKPTGRVVALIVLLIAVAAALRGYLPAQVHGPLRPRAATGRR